MNVPRIAGYFDGTLLICAIEMRVIQYCYLKFIQCFFFSVTVLGNDIQNKKKKDLVIRL
jgi:hypothetical protein